MARDLQVRFGRDRTDGFIRNETLAIFDSELIKTTWRRNHENTSRREPACLRRMSDAGLERLRANQQRDADDVSFRCKLRQYGTVRQEAGPRCSQSVV